MNPSIPPSFLCAIFAALFLASAPLTHGDPYPYRLVASFNPYPLGSYPQGIISGPDGNYYGFTQIGGLYGSGAVFRLTPAGVYTVLASLNYQTTGAFPTAIAIGHDGNIYGTAEQGGPGGEGTLFKIIPGGTVMVLHAFSGPDGKNPSGVIQGSDGNLYTPLFTNMFNDEVLARTNPQTDAFSIFDQSAVVDFTLNYQGSDGNFYGIGSEPDDSEDIVKVTPDGQVTLLQGVTDAPNVVPGPNNSIYYISENTILNLSQTGVATTVATFSSSGPTTAPLTLLLGQDGNFYGVGAGFGSDSIYEATPSGIVTTLVTGVSPRAYFMPDFLARALNGDLAFLTYGIGSVQGVHNGVVSTLIDFDVTNLGPPAGPAMQAWDGNFYGVAQLGDSGLSGIYQVTPSGEISTVVSSVLLGQNPWGLTQASDGNLYGPSINNVFTIIFKVTPGRTLSTLHTFTNNGPRSRLIQSRNKNLYGLASGRSTYNLNFYCLSTKGIYSNLCTLAPGDADSHQIPPLVVPFLLDRDGDFYATNMGNVYKITPTGSPTLLAKLTAESGYFVTGLIQGSDGNLYGSTTDGGTNHLGAIFKITLEGDLTTVFSFTSSTDSIGSSPSSMILGNDGNLYVTTYVGPNNEGAVVQITPAGSATPFVANSIVGLPGSVFQGFDGTLYGTSEQGGLAQSGAIFNINPDLLSGTIIGTASSWQNSGNTIENAFDGNPKTYFDGPSPDGDWVGLDLGSVKKITAISYFPRITYENRMVGGVFQGSNTPDFTNGVTNLAPPIKSSPGDRFNTVLVNGSFRYVRYLSPAGGFGDIAELEFFGETPTPTP